MQLSHESGAQRSGGWVHVQSGSNFVLGNAKLNACKTHWFGYTHYTRWRYIKLPRTEALIVLRNRPSASFISSLFVYLFSWLSRVSSSWFEYFLDGFFFSPESKVGIEFFVLFVLGRSVRMDFIDTFFFLSLSMVSKKKRFQVAWLVDGNWYWFLKQILIENNPWTS